MGDDPLERPAVGGFQSIVASCSSVMSAACVTFLL